GAAHGVRRCQGRPAHRGGDAPAACAARSGGARAPARDAARGRWLARRSVGHGRMDAGARRVTAFDPLELEVMGHAFAAVAEEMGAVLVRGALSPNIRERRDSSAALFDQQGRMIAQAAHIPVHLGAMPESVRAVRERGPVAGDVFLLNDPYRGGSHLPDLTLIEAIGHDDGAIAGYAAVRAHHADVGGMSPGSMPQGATELVQEGIVLPPVHLVRAGRLDDEMLELVLANVRTPEERRGDLRAPPARTPGARSWPGTAPGGSAPRPTRSSITRPPAPAPRPLR